MTNLTQADARAEPYAGSVLCGESAAVTRLRLQIARLAPHFRTALLTGEDGVGTATVAREMHRLSTPRSLPEPLTEMEIDRFAAGEGSPGLIGVLFLSGLDGLPVELQEPLVRRLKTIQREVRILISSSSELRHLLATGRVGQALASRIGSLELRVPPLRERLEDLEVAARTMLRQLGTERELGEATLVTLGLHDWPGNLAELWQVAEHLVRHQENTPGVFEPADLPPLLSAARSEDCEVRLDQVMRKHVREVLERCSGNKLKAAELLGISRSTLYRMLGTAPPG